jgi:hypothetical protein
MLFNLNKMEDYTNLNRQTNKGYIGYKVNKKLNPRFNPNSHWISFGLPGNNYLGIAQIPKNYKPGAQDQPLSYGYGGNVTKSQIPFAHINPSTLNKGFTGHQL